MDTLYVFLLKLAVPWAVCSAPLHRVVYISDLTVSEIIGQVVIFGALTKEQIHSVVVMGAGEPLQNYDNVLQSLQLLHDPMICNISYRKMTISTCGWVPNIYKLADEGLPITLALSLHATK